MIDQIDKSGPLDSEQQELQRLLGRLQKTEAEARTAQELLQGILNAIDSSADAIIIYDADGNTKYISDSFTRLFGWTKEELLGKRIPFVPESEKEVSLAGINRMMQDGKPLSGFETKRTRKDGTVLDVSISSSRYLDSHGEPSGVLVILRDITAWKSMQRARQRAVNHLSHELTTPLAIIDASLPKLGRHDLSPEERQKSLARVRRNLARLKEVQLIVQQMVAPSKYRPRPFPVIPFVLDTLDTLRKRSSNRSVALLHRLQPVDSTVIDPDMLKRVLHTLVKNAIENTPDGGTVTVIMESAQSGPLLQVEDRGVGILREDLPFIFEAFHHTQDTEHYSTKRPFDFNAGGKGLELMQLKMLADEGYMDIRFETSRCLYLPTLKDHCPGGISMCEHVNDERDCRKSGGTTFSVLFKAPNVSG
ncbi:MAG: PAS domain S-box protein [Desulfomonile tiedjei]|uniref:histidine kinase n=1 Tax=Desulfomonile tiedjei TaxID=2358 RepID=A0A9D6V5Z2_9BACT|nr:PAS domain S-box protein [Desulfomonile tiedjei]